MTATPCPDAVRAGHPKAFLGKVCACDLSWSAASIVEEQIARVREQVGSAKVICGLSGVVDSSVAALLCAEVPPAERRAPTSSGAPPAGTAVGERFTVRQRNA